MTRSNYAAFQPFDALSPDAVIAAVESVGLACDGRVLALGSYENRVYQVGREEADPVVVKFYRPERWSDAAIVFSSLSTVATVTPGLRRATALKPL